jgi:hypothetical protein
MSKRRGRRAALQGGQVDVYIPQQSQAGQGNNSRVLGRHEVNGSDFIVFSDRNEL